MCINRMSKYYLVITIQRYKDVYKHHKIRVRGSDLYVYKKDQMCYVYIGMLE